MSEVVRLCIAAVLILTGTVSAVISILGVFRFRFVMNRMHCAAILDTLSMAGILGGLMIASHTMEYIPKLAAALIMLWIGSPLASHLVGRMEISIDDNALSHVKTVEEDENGSH